jgi:hypothetical protein
MPAVTSLKNPKPIANAPYVQEDGKSLLQPIKPIVPANPTQADLSKGSNIVMGTAQNLAVQKAAQPSQTMGLVEQQTNKLLQQPELMPKGYVQSQVGQYDRNRADQMKAFQQKYADTANTGATRESAYNFAMQGAQGRSDLQASLDFQKATTDRAAMLDALNLGQNVAKTGSGLDTESFNRLISARGAYEGERAQTAEFGQAEKILGLTQAFTGTQADLDRQLTKQIEAGKITQQEKDRAMDEWKTKAGIASSEKMQDKAIASSEKIAYAGFNQQDLDRAQESYQFNSKQDFDKWAVTKGLDDKAAERIWQANENDKSRTSTEKMAASKLALDTQIAKDNKWLGEQGISLDLAKLEGYTDANGNHVAGTAEIAAGSLGLQAKTVQAGLDELYGYTDKATGKYVPGKMATMNDQNQREAIALYGGQYTRPDGTTGNSVGSLQLEADKVAIQKQGMTLEQAKIMGYDKADGTHVMGELENLGAELGLKGETLKLQQDEILGVVNPTTGKREGGRIANDIKQLQISAQNADTNSANLAWDKIFDYASILGEGDPQMAAGILANAVQGLTTKDPATGKDVPMKIPTYIKDVAEAEGIKTRATAAGKTPAEQAQAEGKIWRGENGLDDYKMGSVQKPFEIDIAAAPTGILSAYGGYENSQGEATPITDGSTVNFTQPMKVYNGVKNAGNSQYYGDIPAGKYTYGNITVKDLIEKYGVNPSSSGVAKTDPNLAWPVYISNEDGKIYAINQTSKQVFSTMQATKNYGK